jgi:hypothetical protein
MVGAVRFELTTSCTRNKRATRLRYAPNQGLEKVHRLRWNCKLNFGKVSAGYISERPFLLARRASLCETNLPMA